MNRLSVYLGRSCLYALCIGFHCTELIFNINICDGKIKDLAKEVGISYPTMHLCLDRVFPHLKDLVKSHRKREVSYVLNEVDMGNISADLAGKLIKEL